jgi:hypothetical protein
MILDKSETASNRPKAKTKAMTVVNIGHKRQRMEDVEWGNEAAGS